MYTIIQCVVYGMFLSIYANMNKDKYVHTLHGNVLQRFETWLSSDCTIKSQCVPTANGRYSKIIVIKVSGCGVGEVCMLHNRKYQCRPSKTLYYLTNKWETC